VFSAITGLAVASGPLVGGAVVAGLSWHWIFWLNVPIGLAAAPLTLRLLPRTFGPAERLDPLGLLLVSAGSFGLVWGLVRGNQSGWTSPEVVGTLAAGAVLLALFAGWQRRAPAPMLPPALFRSRAFTAGNAAIFLTFASLFTGVFFFAQLLQVVLGQGALEAGLRLVPWTVTFLTVAPAAGALADRIGERVLLSTGLVLQAAGLGWLVSVTAPDVSYGQLVGPFVLAGIGVSMAIPCAQSAVLAGAAGADLGRAAGVNSMMRELGGVFGIAVTVAVFTAHGNADGPGGFVDGFRPAIAVAAGLALVGAGCGTLLPRRTATRAPVPVPA
jgi:MFS family permease